MALGGSWEGNVNAALICSLHGYGYLKWCWVYIASLTYTLVTYVSAYDHIIFRNLLRLFVHLKTQITWNAIDRNKHRARRKCTIFTECFRMFLIIKIVSCTQYSCFESYIEWHSEQTVCQRIANPIISSSILGTVSKYKFVKKRK